MNQPPGLGGYTFSDGEIAEAHEKGELLTITIETSRICNLRCRYCFLASGIKTQDELKTGEILDVIDQGADLGAMSVTILGGGETLLHPDIMEIVSYIRKKKLMQVLFTN